MIGCGLHRQASAGVGHVLNNAGKRVCAIDEGDPFTLGNSSIPSLELHAHNPFGSVARGATGFSRMVTGTFLI
jgi:hypothetical protein